MKIFNFELEEKLYHHFQVEFDGEYQPNKVCLSFALKNEWYFTKNQKIGCPLDRGKRSHVETFQYPTQSLWYNLNIKTWDRGVHKFYHPVASNSFKKKLSKDRNTEQLKNDRNSSDGSLINPLSFWDTININQQLNCPIDGDPVVKFVHTPVSCFDV